MKHTHIPSTNEKLTLTVPNKVGYFFLYASPISLNKLVVYPDNKTSKDKFSVCNFYVQVQLIPKTFTI